MFRVVSASQHQGENIASNGKAIAALNPWSVGTTEMDVGDRTFIAGLQAGLGSGYTTHSVDAGAHSQENVIVTRAHPVWPVRNVRVRNVSSAQGDKGIGNDRWMTISERKRLVRGRRPIAHIATHWNAAIQNRTTGEFLGEVSRAKAMEKAGVLLEWEIEDLKRRGFAVVVTGDFNYRMRGRSEEWAYSPNNIFTRQNMVTLHAGLDYLAYTKHFTLVRPVTVIPPGSQGNGSDHPWLVADLKWRKQR